MFRRTRRTGGGWLGLLSGAVCLVWVLASVQGIQAQPREVKIGVIYPMTGGAAQAGWDDKQAIELALDIINTTKYKHLNLPLAKSEGLDKLGGAKITVVIADHQGKPELGLSEAERLVTQEKVAALLGCYHSNVTMTASQVAERMKIPFLNPESSSPQLTRRGFKWFFRTTPHDENFSEAMFLFFKDLEKKKGAKIKTVAILHEDTLYGQDSGRIEKEMAEKAGYKVLDVIQYRRGATSMTSEIQRLKALKPDVLFPTSYASDAILMTKTSKDLDFNPPIVMAQNAGHTDPAFYEAMGTDVDGIASRAVYSPDLAEVIPMLKEVEALYRERTKQAGKERSFSDTALRCFVGFFVLADAINRAGSTDPQAIQAALKATNIPKEMLPVPWRGVKFDETGQNILGRAIIVQYQGGKHWVVWPFDLATQDFVYPIRKWAERK